METHTGYVDGNQPGNGEWEASQVRPSMEAGRSMEASQSFKKNDIESKLEEIEIPFRHFSHKRLQAIGALGGLIAISILPLFTIGGAIGIVLL